LILKRMIELFAMAEQLKLDGLVAKRAGSIYVPGLRTRDRRKNQAAGSGAAGAAMSIRAPPVSG
jgi:hypothetical protein